MLRQINLDKKVTYSIEDLPLPSMFLSTFGQPLSRTEHYNLAKQMYPASYVDGDTGNEWRLASAIDEGFGPVEPGDMILVEQLPNGKDVYHWSFARTWDKDELWAHDKEMLPDNLENNLS